MKIIEYLASDHNEKDKCRFELEVAKDTNYYGQI